MDDIQLVKAKVGLSAVGKRMVDICGVASALREKYLDFAHNNKKNPLDELIFIICSVKTTGDSYEHTYARFRQRFRSFSDIADATESELALALSAGGLQNIKAHQISEIMRTLQKEFGKPTLSPLRRWNDEKSEKFLVSLPGIGKKTARCVMLYSLGRQVFPVDTHCWRICKRLGLVRARVPSRACMPRDMDRLQSKIPTQLRFSLHVNMVSLGRNICTYYDPRCSICPIESLCPKIGVSAMRKRKQSNGHINKEE